MTMNKAGGYDDYNFIADIYDHVTTYRERTDVEFFVDEARKTGGPVLEIGCGTGRVLIPTARTGIEIAGLDLSDHMLERCRANLSSESDDVRSRVTLVKGDMRNFACLILRDSACDFVWVRGSSRSAATWNHELT